MSYELTVPNIWIAFLVNKAREYCYIEDKCEEFNIFIERYHRFFKIDNTIVVLSWYYLQRLQESGRASHFFPSQKLFACLVLVYKYHQDDII